jgi:hypothetical protein
VALCQIFSIPFFLSPAKSAKFIQKPELGQETLYLAAGQLPNILSTHGHVSG